MSDDPKETSDIDEASVEYTFDPDCSFASRYEQMYSAGSHFSSEEHYKLAVQTLQERYGQPDSAYTPSGKFTIASLFGLGMSVPVVFGVTGLLGLILVWLTEQFDLLLIDWLGVEDFIKLYDSPIGEFLSLVDIGAALGIAAVNVMLPSALTLLVGQWTKNRNVVVACGFAAVESFILSMFFFWPWLDDGSTMAPTNFNLMGILPITWVFIFIGALVAPLVSIFTTVKGLNSQKFCEDSQKYLEESFKLIAPIEWLDDVVLSCMSKQYRNLSQIVPDEASKAHASCVLHSHSEAQRGFLEVEVVFAGTYDTLDARNQEKVEDSKDEWLMFSVELSAEECKQFLQAVS